MQGNKIVSMKNISYAVILSDKYKLHLFNLSQFTLLNTLLHDLKHIKFINCNKIKVYKLISQQSVEAYFDFDFLYYVLKQPRR